MATEKDLIKREFVRQVLDDESRRFLRNQTRTIQTRLESHSGRLLSGRSIDVSSADEMDGKFSFTHPDYERFLDMKRTRNRKRSIGYTRSRAARIHNRFAYGHYYSIANRLSSEFTEQVAQAIGEELGNVNINLGE